MADKVTKAIDASEKTEKTVNERDNNQTAQNKPRKIVITIALTLAIIIAGSVAVVTAIAVVQHTSSIRAASAEYDYLRELAEELYSGSEGIELSEVEIEMLSINPHYVAWIRIDGTNIDYPVVRGYNNEKYLTTSFTGEESRAGAIFMDFRAIGNLLNSMPGEDFRHIIVYGHNLREGGMFTDLHRFLDDDFFNANRKITLIVNDQEIEFEIFDARLTDVDDPAYFLGFGAPQAFPRFADRIGAPLRATQIITLSTCVVGSDDDARMILQGYRIIG